MSLNRFVQKEKMPYTDRTSVAMGIVMILNQLNPSYSEQVDDRHLVMMQFFEFIRSYLESEMARDMEKKNYEHCQPLLLLKEQGRRILTKVRHRSSILDELAESLSSQCILFLQCLLNLCIKVIHLYLQYLQHQLPPCMMCYYGVGDLLDYAICLWWQHSEKMTTSILSTLLDRNRVA